MKLKTKRKTLRIMKPLAKWLERYAKRWGLSQAEVVDLALCIAQRELKEGRW